MRDLLTISQMRLSDADAMRDGGMGEELMRRAGESLFHCVLSELSYLGKSRGTVLIVCGNGNNGGDGYVAAQNLYKNNANVAVYQIDGPLTEDCQREKDRYEGEFENIFDFSGDDEKNAPDVIVDCIFGTGLSREVTGVYKAVIKMINKLKKMHSYVISCDIPSGLNGDNGLAMGCAVKADRTLTIGFLKCGLFLNDGADYCGSIKLADIDIIPNGVMAKLCEKKDLVDFFPKRARNSHKGSYGSANICGGFTYPGAGFLASLACERTGCGYVRWSLGNRNADAYAAAFPQIMYYKDPDYTSKAMAYGMGAGVTEESKQKLVEILSSYSGKLILDADALNILGEMGEEGLELLKSAKSNLRNVTSTKDSKPEDVAGILITPHIAEFSRISKYSVEDIQHDPIGKCKEFAQKTGVMVLIKSSYGVVTDGKECIVCITGNTSLSRGGSGDMLAGFVCGLAARGLTLFDAAYCGHYIIGAAADIAAKTLTEYCTTAKDVMAHIPDAILNLFAKSER